MKTGILSFLKTGIKNKTTLCISRTGLFFGKIKLAHLQAYALSSEHTIVYNMWYVK